jgi:O-antigen ligase
MKFQAIFNILKERMAGANFLPVFLLTFLALVILLVLLIRYGTGFLLALAFVFTGLLLINSDVVAGLVLVARFPLVVVLALYAFFGQKNRVSLSKTTALLAFLPVVMFLNSARAWNRMDALGQSSLFLLFYVGLILGGQRILGDVRGRSVYTKTIAVFTIIMTCAQIPFWSSSQGRLTGTFQSTVGFMIIGVTGIIILVWLGLQQEVWSLRFIFFMLFSAIVFVLLVLTGGRGSLLCAMLGILLLSIRRLKRNIVIFLASLIILGPICLELIVSFPGFENVKAQLFSTKDTRTYVWKLAMDDIKVKPWFGWGTGTSAITSVQKLGYSYHQSYLELAIDHGAPFSIFMMLIFLWLPFRGLLLMRRCQTEELKNMANLSVALLAVYVFSTFLASDLVTTTGVLPVYSAIALMEGVRAENREIELYGYEPYYEEDSLLEQTSQEMWQKDYAGREQL